MSWEKDDAWSKNTKPGARRPRGRARTGKNAPADDAQREDSTWAVSKRKAEKRQKRRRLGWIAAALALVLLVALALLPTIAGAVAPGVIASAGSDAIAGRVEVQRVSLSWFGPQRVEGLILYDTDDTRRSDLDITASKGLLALAFAGGDYGTVTIAGSLDASPNARGEPFTEHTVGPASPAPSQPAQPSAPPSLPKNLKATLALDGLQIQYADPARTQANAPVDAVRIDDLSGTIAIDTAAQSAGQSAAGLAAELKGDITRRLTGAALYEKAGSLAIDATASDLTDADGLLTPDRAAIDATIKADRVESAIAQLFADLQGDPTAALGETVALTLTARGKAGTLATTARFESAGATLNAPLTIDLGARTIASADPITATLDTERLSHLMPDRESIAGPDAEFAVTQFPSLRLAIDALRLPIPESGALDLRGAGATVTLELGALAARVPDPANPGSDPAARRAVGLEPATLTVRAPDLAERITVEGSFNTTIDGVRSGTLAIDLAAADLLAPDGSPAVASATDSQLPKIEGAIRAQRLALQAFQPIAGAFGLDLVDTLGDTADLTIEAAPADNDATSFTIAGSAPHAAIDGAFAFRGGAVRTAGRPLTIRLDRPDAAIAPFLADAGVRITDASGLTATLDRVAVDTGRIAAGDLRATAFDLTATIDRLDAALPTGEPAGDQSQANQPARPGSASIANLRLRAAATDLAEGLRLTAGNDFTLDGQPAGTVSADITVADILTDTGAPAQGVPSDINATVALRAVRTAALAPFVATPALDLPADIGPTLDLTLAAEPTGPNARSTDGSTDGSAAGSNAPSTRATLTVNSANLNGRGSLIVTPDRITAADGPITLRLANLGPLLERAARTVNTQTVTTPTAAAANTRPETKAAATPGPIAPNLRTAGPRVLAITIADLDAPTDPATLAADARATLTATLTGVGVTTDQGPAGTLRTLTARLALAPDADPTLTIDGELVGAVVNDANPVGTIEGRFTLANALAPVDDRGRLALAPNGTLTARNIPTTLARALNIPLGTTPERPGLSLASALTRLAGTNATITLETARETGTANPADTPLRVTLGADAGPHTLDATLALVPADAGPLTIADLSADATLAINQPTLRTVLAIASRPDADTATVDRPGSLALQVRNEAGTVRAQTTLGPTTIAGLQTGAPAAASPNQTAPNAAPTAPTTLPPLTLEGLANLTAPLAMLADPAGSHKVSLNADLKGTDPARPDTPVLTLAATADATLADATPTGPLTADIRVDAGRTQWLDALAGTDGLLTEALGDRLRLTSQLSAEFAVAPSDAETSPMPKSARASASIDAPRLRTARPATLVVQDDTLRLAEPFSGSWTFSPELFRLLAPTEPGKAAQASLASNATFEFAAEKLVFPLGAENTKPVDLKASLAAPALPLRLADDSTYTLTDIAASLSSMPTESRQAGRGRLLLTASTRETPNTNAISLDATVNGLPAPGVDFDPRAVALDGVAKVDQLPMQLVDALANADGQLVTLLGDTLNIDATLRNLPRQQGTISFRADTPQSNARYNATVRPHPADPGTLALITDEPATATITHFEFDFAGKRVGLLPVFGALRKVEQTHRPASVRIARLVAPVDGDPEKIVMQGTVDPGVIQYEFERGLAALLKAANQRTMSNAGERLEPFNIAMNQGVARFDSLRLPLGEFTLDAKGSFDLVRQYEDITLGIPAGAFAGEAIGNLPGATGGLLNEDVRVPVRRRGPMGADNKWEPDFEAVLKQLFSPQNILDNVIKGGLKDIIKDGAGQGGGGAGGG